MGKYEEAMERAKQGLPIDEVFPELKESEDERIIEYLIRLMRQKDQKVPMVQKAIAYLERQKEQQPAGWSEEDERKIVELKTFIAQCNGFNKKNQKKAFDMIDAIRHQHLWKPSEGQIEALENSTALNEDQGAHLYSLLCELKKQM